MTINRRMAIKLMGATALAMSASAVFSQESSEAPQQGGTLTVGVVSNSVKTLDPRRSIQIDERQVLFLVYDALLAVDNDFNIKPDLAKSWTVENEGKRYAFILQEGVKFQDGTPFNAEAVKWNIESRLDEKVRSAQRNQLLPVIASVEVVSPLVVVFNLNYPYPSLLSDLADRAGMMISPAAAEKYGADYGQNPVGTGAFLLDEWEQGTAVTLIRNPNYWREDQPYLDSVVFRTVPNVALGLQRISIGEIDMLAEITHSDVQNLVDTQTAVAMRYPAGRWWTMQCQVDKPPFDNPTLRRAIAHALDREQINNIVFGGQGKVADGISAPGLWYTGEQKPTFEYSPDKARELLREAEWNMDEPIKVWVGSEPTYNKISQLVREQLVAVGLKIEMAPIVQSEFYSKVVERVVNLTPITWASRADPDGHYYFIFHKNGTANSTGYNNPKVNVLLEQARSTLEREARKDFYLQVQQIVMQDLPVIPLVFNANYVVVSKKVKNWSPAPDTFPRLRSIWKAA
jgi:peptide/nickel transport system substrate-binding protein